MIQLTPQMRLLLAVEPVDFRNHSVFLIIPSSVRKDPINRSLSGFLLSLARNNQRP